MDPIYLFIIFCFGATIGSYVNVVALRYNSGLSSARGRSKCFSCSKTLKWYEMVPLVSFLVLRGKCRTCKSNLSWQYFIVELLTGLIFVGVAIRQYNLWPIYGSLEHGLLYSILFFIYYVFIFSLLLIVALYDMKHKIIPDVFVYLFIVLGTIKLALFFFFKHFEVGPQDYFDLSSAAVLFVSFGLLYFVSRGRWLGFGDVKLVFGIGALLGFVGGISAVIMAFWIGAVWSVLLIVRSKYFQKNVGKISLQSEIPFAPFLILGTLIAFLTHADILSLGGILNFLS